MMKQIQVNKYQKERTNLYFSITKISIKMKNYNKMYKCQKQNNNLKAMFQIQSNSI